jgi:hypothetical protein
VQGIGLVKIYGQARVGLHNHHRNQKKVNINIMAQKKSTGRDYPLAVSPEPKDSTSYYKSRAEEAAKKVVKDDVRNIGKNVKDFAVKQSEYKAYTKRDTPGYDSKGRSNADKLLNIKTTIADFFK